MKPPRLLAPARRNAALLLALLALGQALAAVLFAEAIDGLLAASANAGPRAALPAVALGLAGGTLLGAERWVAERFAQSFVTDCRAALFDAVIRNAGDGNEARWLSGLVNDMTALRNYALRGTIRLWTSALAAVAAAGWLVLSGPAQRLAMIPLAIGAVLVVAMVRPLGRAIAAQRTERGRLNRFLIRRVRAEMAGAPAPRGHGRNKLVALSATLRRRIEVRAANAGAMDAIASACGALAAAILVLRAPGESGLVGSLTVIGFIAARLLETSRALHARTGGTIALTRLSRLLARRHAPPAARPPGASIPFLPPRNP